MFHIFFFDISPDLCQQAIQQLRSSELITIGTDGDLSILPFGTILAKYFLSIETMKVFREVSHPHLFLLVIT